MHSDPTLDRHRCYRALESRDERFDGWFIVGVKTTGIYCRPSCPTPVRPKPANVDYYRTAAAAQRAGFRACKRCRPDASPGSPEWDMRGDLVGRAMRLIADGLVDREGITGLAAQLAVGERHLHRLFVSELGVGPLAVARAHRAQTARTLIETTDLKFADVAFAAGFSSIRQFNDTIREVFALTPRQLRARTTARPIAGGTMTLRLSYRAPLDAEALFGWLSARSIHGIQAETATGLTRTLRLDRGGGLVSLEPADGFVSCRLQLEELGDLASAVERCRRLLDLDADPTIVAESLGADPVLAPLVEEGPGLRVPGSVDGFETCVFAVLGQQVSVAAATTLAGRIVERFGAERTDSLPGEPDRLFPSAPALADADLDGLGLTGRRRDTIRGMAEAWIAGLRVEPGADRGEVRRKLLEIEGIGPWTADYLLMRALGDPDVFLPGDLIVRRSAAGLGLPDDAKHLAARAESWAPWRSYATHYLWAHPTQTGKAES